MTMTKEEKTRTVAGSMSDDCAGGSAQCKDTQNPVNEQKVRQNDDGMFSLHQTRQMPIDGLPVYVQQIIKEYAAALVAPVDFVAAAVLVAAATAAGKNCKVKTGIYTNHPSGWYALVAPSGFNKSEPVKQVLLPFADMDRGNYLRYREQLEQLEDGDNRDAVHWEQIIISDITPEARNQALMHNPVRLLSYCDELQGMMNNFCRYNKSGEVEQLLSIWSNAGYPVNRKKDIPLCITDPYMNIIGGIQPSVLPSTFGKQLLMGNGWNHRFLYVYPELDKISKRKPREMNQRVHDSWHNMVQQWVQSYSAVPEDCTLSDGAQQVYDHFCDLIIDEINASDDDYRRGMLSKFKIHILRLAATVQVMHGGGEISGETMSYCQRLCDYFIECARAVHEDITCDQQPRTIGNEEFIREIFRRYDVKSQSALADAMGITQPAISKALKKQ